MHYIGHLRPNEAKRSVFPDLVLK